MNANEVVTDAGLVVPRSAVQRKRKALPAATMKVIKQFLLAMPAEEMTAQLLCTSCKTGISFGTVNKILTGQPGGELVLRCKCSDRVVVK